jgi:hypothetical protein
MILRSLFVISIALISVANGVISVDALARCVMSEAWISNKAEQIAIGFACQRNRKHASNQRPTVAITRLAEDILRWKIPDPTGEANHWYSPFSMPKDAQSSQCKRPVGTGIMDCSGGLESVCGSRKNYKPNWAIASKQIRVSNVRDCYYKFFKL